jgi:hypothetical protein
MSTCCAVPVCVIVIEGVMDFPTPSMVTLPTD